MRKSGKRAGTYRVPAKKNTKRQPAKTRVNEYSDECLARRRLARGPLGVRRPAKPGARECQDKAAVRRELTQVILRLSHQATQLGRQIDEAFERQPCIRELPSDHPKNQRRFRVRLGLLAKAFSYLARGVDLIQELYAEVDLLDRLREIGQVAPQKTAAQMALPSIPAGYRIAAVTPSGQLVLKKISPEESTGVAVQSKPTAIRVHRE